MSAVARPAPVGDALGPLLRKLRHGAALAPEHDALLAGLVVSERHAARGEIVDEGAARGSVVLVVRGWVGRFAELENGKRQITALFVPGDLCGVFGAVPTETDQKLGALTPARLAHLPVHALRDAARLDPRLELALWWDAMLADATSRERMVSLGRRTALERLAHFLCEIRVRLARVGLAAGSCCEFPMTQSDLADLLGLTPVHVNRSMQELRRSGLISLEGRRLTLHRPEALRAMAMFDPAYLEPTCVLGGRLAEPGSQRSTAAMTRP